ncbi:hypothetical protein PQR46_08250 [Paraburkholderia sediminicola]|uniref:hypothetical protein n=1 Tax=Paraburkholderia TaxID=1822464 RepID=UPI0038BCDE2B
MKKSERLVFFYDLSIEAHARNFAAPKPISVRRAFELMELVPKDKREKEISKGRESLYMSDWERNGDIVRILVNKSDRGMSDPIFTIPKEGKRRTAEKIEKEGQDFSVHVTVKLPENDLEPALAIVEFCSGLGAFVVQRLFNKVLADAGVLSPQDYVQAHPDGALGANGKPKTINARYTFSLSGHISNELKNDLDKGTVQTIELITDQEQFTPFDEEGYIKEKCKTLVLTLKDEQNPVKDKFNRIVSVFKKNKDDYSRAKVKFKSPSGVDRTVEMTTAEGVAEAYVRKEKLTNFNADLKSSYDAFCDEIVLKMEALLNDGVK